MLTYGIKLVFEVSVSEEDEKKLVEYFNDIPGELLYNAAALHAAAFAVDDDWVYIQYMSKGEVKTAWVQEDAVGYYDLPVLLLGPIRCTVKESAPQYED